VPKEAWREEAKCADPSVYPDHIVDHEMFFPPRDAELYKPIADAAKAICKGRDLRPPCPVRTECLIYAIEREEEHGIFGGASHRERNALVRKLASENKKLKAKSKATMTLRQFIEKSGPV
jgi:WhiB family redox-sensing transcriptional regulator